MMMVFFSLQNMYEFCCAFVFIFTNFSILPSIVVAVYASLQHYSDCAFVRGYVYRDDDVDDDVDNDHDNMYYVPSHILLFFFVFLFCFIYSFSYQQHRQQQIQHGDGKSRRWIRGYWYFRLQPSRLARAKALRI